MATTEQLMAQYGVAWFGFDEASGDVYDKIGLGGYVGTLSGATRVQGWNGEGSSIEMTGSPQFVSFNNPIIPVGEKTIKFKILPSTTIANSVNRRVLDCGLANSTGGISIIINSNKIRLLIRRGGSAYIVDSISDVKYNQWNDIFISYTGKDEPKNVVIGIDGEFYSYYLNTQDSPSYGGMFLGKMNPSLSATGVAEFFIGKLDDLQIYNKTLSPSNFEQTRLAVKTTDNKNLTVLDSRVKEIPNIIESTLLEQGRTIREIDNAVDAKPVELTFSSTQYEITNNVSSPLGNSKVFSLPISKEFKTIVIEDNY